MEVRKTWVAVKRGLVMAKLGSKPDDWFFNRTGFYGSSHCELCGTQIVWNYGLENKTTHKVLMVGCECIRNYYEAYMPPDGIKFALDYLKRIQKRLADRVLRAKIEKFKSLSPICEWAAKCFTGYSYPRIISARVFKDGAPSEAPERICTDKFRTVFKRRGYFTTDELLQLVDGIAEERQRMVEYNKKYSTSWRNVYSDMCFTEEEVAQIPKNIKKLVEVERVELDKN